MYLNFESSVIDKNRFFSYINVYNSRYIKAMGVYTKQSQFNIKLPCKRKSYRTSVIDKNVFLRHFFGYCIYVILKHFQIRGYVLFEQAQLISYVRRNIGG